jgi:hypothetical protein
MKPNYSFKKGDLVAIEPDSSDIVPTGESIPLSFVIVKSVTEDSLVYVNSLADLDNWGGSIFEWPWCEIRSIFKIYLQPIGPVRGETNAT